MQVSKTDVGKKKMRKSKNFLTVIGFTSAALLLIALDGNASGNMTLNNQIPNQGACTTAKPDEGYMLGHSVPDTNLMGQCSEIQRKIVLNLESRYEQNLETGDEASRRSPRPTGSAAWDA